MSVHKTVCWTEYKIMQWGSLFFFFFLPLRPHSPADSESVAMTELQEKKKRHKNMNHHIIISHKLSCCFSQSVWFSVTRDWMCQRCRWIHSILPLPPLQLKDVCVAVLGAEPPAVTSLTAAALFLSLSFFHQNHLIRYNFPVIPPIHSPSLTAAGQDRQQKQSSPDHVVLEPRRTELSRNRQEKN